MKGHRTPVEDLRRLCEAGQAAGEFGPFSASVTAVSLRASVDAISGLLRADPAVDVDAYGAPLLGLFERAVRPGQPPSPRRARSPTPRAFPPCGSRGWPSRSVRPRRSATSSCPSAAAASSAWGGPPWRAD